MTRALLKRTVETLRDHQANWSEATRQLVLSIDAELAKPDSKPDSFKVRTIYANGFGQWHYFGWVPTVKKQEEELVLLYTHPAQQERKPMNSDQIFRAWATAKAASHISFTAGIEAAEAFHNIKDAP